MLSNSLLNLVLLPSCLVDGLYDGSSKFKAPRSKPDTLQFTVAVFHFANDSRHTVNLCFDSLGAGWTLGRA